MILSIITAFDNNQLIGNNNGLPWRLPADLQFFKKVTMSKPILMGRKTYESIGRPLPGRRNLVISRDTSLTIEGCELYNSIESAIAAVTDVEEAMVIGGANIYEQCLEYTDRLYITRVDGEFEGDAWFPVLDLSHWVVTNEEAYSADEKNECDYAFVIYDRVKKVLT